MYFHIALVEFTKKCDSRLISKGPNTFVKAVLKSSVDFLSILMNRFPLQAHDSAGRAVSLLGFACGISPVPLVPQEVARLPLQSNSIAPLELYNSSVFIPKYQDYQLTKPL
ncbi:hypothetical protein BSG1_18040 [Bacillus sp. SG-1]|nr:hypothetical protein BSG1_18040 [Bacillus sp. SG-1]